VSKRSPHLEEGQARGRLRPKSAHESVQRPRAAPCLATRTRFPSDLAKAGELLPASQAEGQGVHPNEEEEQVTICDECGEPICPKCGECLCPGGRSADDDDEEEMEEEDEGDVDDDSSEVHAIAAARS